MRKKDDEHFSGTWRLCTLSPPDLVFITKVLKDEFDIYSAHIYVTYIGWSCGGTPITSAST